MTPLDVDLGFPLDSKRETFRYVVLTRTDGDTVS